MIIAEDYSGEGLHLWHPYVFKYEFDFSDILPKIRPTYEAALNHWAAQTDQTKVESIPNSTTSRVGRYEYTLEPHNQKCMKPFNMWLGARISWVWQQFGYLGAESEISQSWFNRHEKGGQTKEHTHNAIELVVASYLQNDGEGQGNIEIKDPLEYHKTGYPYDAEKEIWKEIKCPTNTVLIFPGWVNHRSQVNKVGGERMVMTYNINARLFKCDVYENRFVLPNTLNAA